MKKLPLLKRFIIAASILFLSFGLTSCLDSDNYEQVYNPVKVTDVVGTYSGQILAAQGNIRSNRDIQFSVLGSVISTPSFPVNEIVGSVISDYSKATEVVKNLGKVQYDLDYTANLSSDGKEVQLKLAPKPLTLSMPIDGVQKNVSVIFTTQFLGSYTSSDRGKILNYMISADTIKVNNEKVLPYNRISYVVSALRD